MSRFAPLPQRTLEDKTAETVRRETARAIAELQEHAQAVRPFPAAARSYLGRQVFTSTGTYTPTAETRAVILRMVGGGGGGGGTTGGAGAAAGGGGFSGVYLEKFIVSTTPITGGPVTSGAGGAAGAAGADGSTGGSTSIVINGKTYSASGGIGGKGQANGSSTTSAGTPALSAAPAYFDVYSQGIGALGIRFGAADCWPGAGGSSPFGQGGVTTAIGDGAPGRGCGGGGGGAASLAASKIGGAGAGGCVIVEEFS